MQVEALVSTTEDHREVLSKDQVGLTVANLSDGLNRKPFDTSEVDLLILCNIFFEKLEAGEVNFEELRADCRVSNI